MKIVTSVVLAALAVSPALATPLKFYGNVAVTGSQGCSVVQGSFPVTASYTNGVTLFSFNILIQNQSLGLPLNFLNVAFTPVTSSGGTAEVYDLPLFGTNAGQPSNYTGAPFLNGAGFLRVDGGGTPLVLTQSVSASSPPPCVLSFTGVLFPSN